MQSITIEIEYSGILPDNTGDFKVIVKRNGKHSAGESWIFIVSKDVTASEAHATAVAYAISLLQELNLLPNNE